MNCIVLRFRTHLHQNSLYPNIISPGYSLAQEVPERNNIRVFKRLISSLYLISYCVLITWVHAVFSSMLHVYPCTSCQWVQNYYQKSITAALHCCWSKTRSTFFPFSTWKAITAAVQPLPHPLLSIRTTSNLMCMALLERQANVHGLNKPFHWLHNNQANPATMEYNECRFA